MSGQPGSELSSERPFPGLRPFAFEDRDFFFGREAQTYALYRLIVQSRFVAVVGSSGSGKSSLVRAGLLPLLADESDDPGGRKWELKEMRPGGAPLSRLADALAELSHDDDPAIAATRRERIEFDLRSSFGIAKVLDKIDLGGATLLLVVDQFEELFRFAGSGAHGTEVDLRDAMRSRDEAADFVKLLLEASRSPSHQVRVLLTMRSDFIGECARFQGLPEAVSATQFLVPSLTRDQREEIIRGPIEKAGGTIDPTLVQRLLNDSSDDLDQLPVLQHCLLRLWERAGTSGRGNPATVVEPAASDGAAGVQPVAVGRQLVLEHYESIGRISGALAQHAEEILANLVGLEHVVERVFRALAEIDKEGRAIRRALPFGQLCGETGEPEQDVRRVVDRFRADDCSFLVPSLSSALRLEPDARIDVGHEALLRRWDRARGWLQIEARDGEQYRRLLSRAENEQDVLPLKTVGERWQWWNAQPRTAAWAERYGGGLDRVDRLIRDSLRRKRRIVRSAVALGCLVLLGSQLSWWMYLNYQKRIERLELDQQIGRLEAEKQATIAEQNFQLAVSSAQKVVDQVAALLNYGTISVKGAKELLKTVGVNLGQVETVRRTPETAQAAVNLGLTVADIHSTLGDLQQAYSAAKAAKEFAAPVLEADPNNPKFLLLVYGASWRMGDALADRGNDPEMLERALKEFRNAMALAQQLASMAPDSSAHKRDLMFVHQKIGDIRQQQKNPDGAIEEYRAALGHIQAVVEKEPQNTDWRRDHANTMIRLGQALIDKRDFEAALKHYQDAYEIRIALAARDPNNDVLQSNIASTHVEFGKLNERRNDLDAALTEYKTALEIRERLAQKDPDNANWQVTLAPLHAFIGGVLRKKNDLAGALEHYTKTFQLRQQLAIRDPSNPERRQSVATTMNIVADLMAAQDRTNDALLYYSEALLILEDLAQEHPTVASYRAGIFSGHTKLGDRLMQQSRREEALQQYRAALGVAQRFAESDANNLVWQKNLVAAYVKVGDALAAAEDRNQALEPYKTALARAEELTVKYPKNADFPAQHQSIKTKIEQLEPQLATEPRQ
jgi:tetratricopeptide (TPR) repeat protein